MYADNLLQPNLMSDAYLGFEIMIVPTKQKALYLIILEAWPDTNYFETVVRLRFIGTLAGQFKFLDSTRRC